MVKISSYFNPHMIFFFDVSSRDEALEKMVGSLQHLGQVHHSGRFLQAIIEREKVVSTGIGMGVAIPHAKLPEYDSFFIALAVLSKGVEWGALDGAPVRLIFMIGGPDDKQTEYLQVLSAITLVLKEEEVRKKILTLNSKEAIIELFQGL